MTDQTPPKETPELPIKEAAKAALTPPPSPPGNKNDGRLNFKPSTIFTGDNLHIMRGVNSETIDLIYLDPPFNSNTNYAAPIGSPAQGAEFRDVWSLQDIDVAWLDSIHDERPHLWHILKGVAGVHSASMLSYLVYMIPRLEEMRRLLKPTGSIYLHCDPTASHYLKMVMDSVFGQKNLRRELIWNLQTASGYKSKVNGWIRGHDTILYYSKSSDFTFNKQYKPHKPEYQARFRKTDEHGRKYRDDRGGRRQYLDNTQGVAYTDVWDDVMSFQQNSASPEYTGYPTQKPLALLERIISASSNRDDMRLAEEFKVLKKCIRRTDIPNRTDLGSIPKYNCKGNKKDLYGEQQGECNGCEKHFEMQNLTVDHIVAKDVGGNDHISNLQLLCGHCNSIKGKKSQEHLKARLAELGILSR